MSAAIKLEARFQVNFSDISIRPNFKGTAERAGALAH
jgi:hypothetical protein